VLTDLKITQTLEQLVAARNDVSTRADYEYRNQIMHWLSTGDPSSNHLAARKKHQPSTGNWLFAGTDFAMWKKSRNSLLWLYGIRKIPSNVVSNLFPIPGNDCQSNWLRKDYTQVRIALSIE